MDTYTNWQPVALVPASLSDEDHTTLEVVETRGGIYVAALSGDEDARDCCMTMDEARQVALAILAVTGPEPTAAPIGQRVARLRSSRHRSATRAPQLYLRAVA